MNKTEERIIVIAYKIRKRMLSLIALSLACLFISTATESEIHTTVIRIISMILKLSIPRVVLMKTQLDFDALNSIAAITVRVRKKEGICVELKNFSFLDI
jgi:hypothetical protein